MAKGQKIGYVRVSTLEQSIERQLIGIELDKKFIDKLSGKNTDRSQFQIMMDYVREGDIVIVHSMDRLARNLDDLRNIVNNLTKKGVSVQFIKENLTFTGDDSPMANLLLSMMGAFAEFERDIILERQREGIRLAKIRGAYKGRKKKLSADQVIQLKEMISNRYRVTDIAKKFNVKRTTLYNYLKNEAKLNEENT